MIDEMSRQKQELSDLLARKEAEAKGLGAKVEEAHGQLAASSRRVKELQQQVGRDTL
jgi:hypothetical protein